MTRSYLRFREVPKPGRKTIKVMVEAKSNAAVLGRIEWWPPWRQYCFFPTAGTLFNNMCLMEIALEVARLTKDHRARRPDMARKGSSVGTE